MKRAYKKLSSRQSIVWIALLASVAALSAGCGKQAYVTTGSIAAQQAPGSFAVAPKVDILLMQDDTPSIVPAYSNIKAQLNTFLSNLQGRGWDYHLATVPLTTDRVVQQVQASKYDPNWGSQWIPPYPGALARNIETVSANAFRLPGDYTDFLGPGDHGASNSFEPAFDNLRNVLSDASMTSTGFIRQDALLAIVVLSTGDDVSGGRNFCSGKYAQSDGWEGPCDLIQVDRENPPRNPSIECGHPGAISDDNNTHCNNFNSSMLPYESYLQSYKGAGNWQQVRFYSVVSALRHVSGGTCLGTNTYQGARYQKMTRDIGGQSYDICSEPIPNALDGIGTNLTAFQLNLYTSYLFMAQEPNPDTITVYRNPGGDASQAVKIPADANNGWTFVGNVSDVYTTAIGSPAATPTLNMGSGWAVQLHGTGIIGGADTATVKFTPAGINNSAQ